MEHFPSSLKMFISSTLYVQWELMYFFICSLEERRILYYSYGYNFLSNCAEIFFGHVLGLIKLQIAERKMSVYACPIL